MNLCVDNNLEKNIQSCFISYNMIFNKSTCLLKMVVHQCGKGLCFLLTNRFYITLIAGLALTSHIKILKKVDT